MAQRLRKMAASSWRGTSRALGLPNTSLSRWRLRVERSEPAIRKRGPTKVQPPDMGAILASIKKLESCRERTHGTTKVFQGYQETISRRDFNDLVRQARDQANAELFELQRRVIWHEPGLAWAMDETEYKLVMGKTKLLNLRDLSTAYKFPPLEGQSLRGEDIASHLEEQVSQFGPPLFLKRDNGSALNDAAVNKVLSGHIIIPLNSPPYYSPYNGAIEHDHREIKERIAAQISIHPAGGDFHLGAYAQSAIHDLNHQPRRHLKGRTSCEAYFAKRTCWTCGRRERQRVFEWIRDLARQIAMDMNDHDDRSKATAWRMACETWLVRHGHIEINRRAS